MTDARPAALIVCRSTDALPLLRSIRLDDGWNYIVGSDDPGVHTACRAMTGVGDVCWLEQMESYYGLAADVLRMLDAINRWLRSIADERFGFSEELLQWLHHAEGGQTTERLQDAALLIRSYQALFDRYRIQRVHICARHVTFEDAVLEAVADAAGAELAHHGRPGLFSRRITAACRVPYRVALAAIDLFRRRAASKRDAADMRGPAEDGLVAFQLGSTGDKHIENVVPLMKALERAGRRSVALTCFLPDVDAKLRANGLCGVDTARLLPAGVVAEALRRSVVTLIRAVKAKRAFAADVALAYQGVRLNGVLWPVIRDFLTAEMPARYCLKAAFSRFFKSQNTVALRLWGEVSLPEGYVAWLALSESNRPLLFDYWLGVGGDWPYWRRDNPIDLFLTPGAIQRELLLSRGVALSAVADVGSLRYDDLVNLKNNTSREMSRREIDAPSTDGLCIFWDPNTVLRGCLTAQEQLRVTDALVKLTAAHACGLIVKPHPSHKPGALERLLKAAGHVCSVDRSKLPYHSLNASDIVVTKVSTIALEAMMLDKPVISVSLDGEPRWRKIYGDAVEYVASTEQLTGLLAELLDDDRRRSTWTAERLAVQRAFLARYFRPHANSPADLAAAAIVSRLEQPVTARLAHAV